MSRTYEALTSGLDQDFQQVIHNLRTFSCELQPSSRGELRILMASLLVGKPGLLCRSDFRKMIL
jgi:hypothetical protein